MTAESFPFFSPSILLFSAFQGKARVVGLSRAAVRCQFQSALQYCGIRPICSLCPSFPSPESEKCFLLPPPPPPFSGNVGGGGLSLSPLCELCCRCGALIKVLSRVPRSLLLLLSVPLWWSWRPKQAARKYLPAWQKKVGDEGRRDCGMGIRH